MSKPKSNDRRRERKPLEWKEEDQINKGNVRVQINSAMTEAGSKLFSFSVGRVTREGNTTRFVNFRDMNQLRALLTDVEVWVENDLHELDEKRLNDPKRSAFV